MWQLTCFSKSGKRGALVAPRRVCRRTLIKIQCLHSFHIFDDYSLEISYLGQKVDQFLCLPEHYYAMMCALFGNSNSTDVSFLKRWEEQREDAKLQPCAAVVRSAEGAIIIRLFVLEKKSHRTFEGWLRSTGLKKRSNKEEGRRGTKTKFWRVPFGVFRAKSLCFSRQLTDMRAPRSKYAEQTFCLEITSAKKDQ